jgi:hypothetical protein
MAAAFGDGDKGRQVAVMVQQGVDFDGALGSTEGSPGEQGKAKLHHGGV